MKNFYDTKHMFIYNDDINFKKVMTDYFIVSEKATAHNIHILCNIGGYLSTFLSQVEKSEPFKTNTVMRIIESTFPDDEYEINVKYIQHLVDKLNAIFFPDTLDEKQRIIYNNFIKSRYIFGRGIDANYGRVFFMAYILAGHTAWYQSIDEADIGKVLNKLSDKMITMFDTECFPIIPILYNIAANHNTSIYYSFLSEEFDFAGETIIEADGISKLKFYTTANKEYAEIWSSFYGVDSIRHVDGEVYYEVVAKENGYSSMSYSKYLELPRVSKVTKLKDEFDNNTVK